MESFVEGQRLADICDIEQNTRDWIHRSEEIEGDGKAALPTCNGGNSFTKGG